MKPPICPMQNVPPVDQAPVSWVTKMLFGKVWWLFFQGVARGLANLLNFPLYHDLVMFFPGALTVTAFLSPSYPTPPQQRVGPYTFNVWLFTPPTGADIHVKIHRSDSFATEPPVLGGMMAEFTILAGLPLPLAITYYADQNFTVPFCGIYVEITQIGSVTPGSDLRILARVEGAT